MNVNAFSKPYALSSHVLFKRHFNVVLDIWYLYILQHIPDLETKYLISCNYVYKMKFPCFLLQNEGLFSATHLQIL